MLRTMLEKLISFSNKMLRPLSQYIISSCEQTEMEIFYTDPYDTCQVYIYTVWCHLQTYRTGYFQDNPAYICRFCTTFQFEQHFS